MGRPNKSVRAKAGGIRGSRRVETVRGRGAGSRGGIGIERRDWRPHGDPEVGIMDRTESGKGRGLDRGAGAWGRMSSVGGAEGAALSDETDAGLGNPASILPDYADGHQVWTERPERGPNGHAGTMIPRAEAVES